MRFRMLGYVTNGDSPAEDLGTVPNGDRDEIYLRME